MADPVQNASTGPVIVSGVPVTVHNNVIMKPPGADNGQSKVQDLAFVGGGQQSSKKEKDLGKIVDSLNHLLDVGQAEVRFSIFKDPDTIVVRLVDQSSGEMIREIPSVKILQMIHSLMETMGIFIDAKV